jgi:3-hydroxy-9,10-secoandrosta-1,3,5(10)-triene-9,17-dione monooxygenase
MYIDPATGITLPSAIHTSSAAANEAGAEMVLRARALGAMLQRNAAKTEADRRVVEENIQAMSDAGLFHVMLPKRYGGPEAGVSNHLDVVSTLAEFCPSSAWVANLIGVCTWFASLLPAQAQDDIFGANPKARIAGVFTPSSQTHRKAVEGGLVVSGKWYYASGCLHADWGLIGLTEQDESGKVIDQYLAYVPMSDLTIEETWFTVGMKGSGSNCIVAQDVFIPDHRMYSMPRALQGDYATEFKDEMLYHSAFVPLAAIILAGPQLGMGRAALRYVTEMADKRGIAYTVYGKQSESVAFQLQIAEAAMKIESAHLHAYRAAADIERFAALGEQPDYKTRARMRCDNSHAITLITEAMNQLITAHGSGAFAESSPLQRLWRDSNTAARHAVALPQISLEVYGKALLGVDTMVTPLV